MKKNRRKIFTLCYLALVFAITLVLAFTLSKEGEGLFHILVSLNGAWLAAAAGCMVMYLLSEGLVAWYITSFMYKKLKYSYIARLNVIGNYYGALTPGAFGFQPSQIAYMKRDGVPVGISTFIQTIKLIAYEIVIVSLCLIFMSIKGAYFYRSHPQVFGLSVFGACLNTTVIVIMVLAIVRQDTLKRFVLAVTRFLSKIRIIRNPDKVRLSVEHTLADFHDSAKYLKQHKARVALACLLTMVQWLFFFSIPYFLYNAFGLGMLAGQPGAYGTVSPLDEAVTLIAMAAFLFLAVHFIPIPGASGATEAGFGIFFGSFFFGSSAAAMLLWRMITYYSLIALGFILIFLDGLLRKKKGANSGQAPGEEADKPPEEIQET